MISHSQLSPKHLKSEIRRFDRNSQLMKITLMVLIALVALLPNAIAKKKSEPQSLPAASAMEQPPLALLSSEAQSHLSAVRADPPPPEIVRNSHYWVSNEHNHQLWLPYIQGTGGALVGVGTDQNYLLAGWAKSSLLILMDFDQEIPNLHQIYQFFFSISDSPQNLIDRWSKKYGEDSALKLEAYLTPIARDIAIQEAAKQALSEEKSERFIAKQVKRYVAKRVKIFKRTRGLLWRRLTKTRKKYQDLKIPTFLDDQGQYDHIRGLWATGRVLAIRGDLTADHTMLDIAEALRAIGEPLRVLYLSNAEQYFPLSPTYRRNLINLPWGEQSYALRTMGWGSLGFLDDDEKYHYNVQTGENIVAWMQKGTVTKAGRMMFKGREIKQLGFSEMVKPPVEGKRLPEVAKLPQRD